MSAPVLFLDCETTGLSLENDEIWEIAAIRRDEHGETELHLFVDHWPSHCRRLPEPFASDHRARFPRDCMGGGNHGPGANAVLRRDQAVDRLLTFIGGDRPHLIGAVPSFDDARLHRLLHAEGARDPWHYHVIDVETLAVGYLASAAEEYPGGLAADYLARGLPWDSNELSSAVGINPEEFERHTAMGDVRWCVALYDAVMGSAR